MREPDLPMPDAGATAVIVYIILGVAFRSLVVPLRAVISITILVVRTHGRLGWSPLRTWV